jgi:hypothetical protein
MDEEKMASIRAWLVERGYSPKQIDTAENALLCIWQEISAVENDGAECPVCGICP